MGERLEDRLVAAALAIVAGLCLSFRYLPLVDLPQHYAMVSILAHHRDPAFDFAQRYTFDFVGRPYATVYWMGAALARVLPLGGAMRLVVAVCTVAPLAGTYALLVATQRPRMWVLAAVPFAFGSLWYWGFLNFLLGTGLLMAGLALVVRRARRPTRRNATGLALWAPLVLFTHFHGLAMLLAFAPLLAWAYGDERTVRGWWRTLWPLAPGAAAGAAFVLVTWSQAEGSWAQMNPGLGERVARFVELLGAGVPDPWPSVWLLAFVGVAAVGVVLAGKARPPSPRPPLAFAAILLAQVVLYLALPLNTNTATYVSARHALLCVLFALPLLPAVDGSRRAVVRALAVAICALALVVIGRQLARFDGEAHDFDPVLAAMKPGKRVLPLIFERGSRHASRSTFPYLHFAAYGQAARGGDLSHSFATVWNVPIRYRADYRRYPLRDQVEWAPQTITADELAHFDEILLRSPVLRSVPFAPQLRELARSGDWTLWENPTALPDELPAR